MKNHKKIWMMTWALLLIGGLNWGLIGLGMLMGSDLNALDSILGKWPTAEAILYVLVGLAALKVTVAHVMGIKNCNCCAKCECKLG